MDEVIGRSYEFKPRQLKKRESFIVEGRPDLESTVGAEIDDDDKLVGEDRKFFCSELVAKCYKLIGIMPTKQASSNFLPSNLSSDNFTLPIIPEISIDNEKFILPPEKDWQKEMAFKE